MARTARRALYAVVPDVTGRIEARLDQLSPAAALSWGASFNGQDRRRELVQNLLHSCDIQAIVETGTYRGTTTTWFAEQTDVTVVTVEVNSRFYHYSRARLARFQNVKVISGDSRRVLHSLGRAPGFPKDRVFFYLDAHWYSAQPLKDELKAIAIKWVDWIALIDDLIVPDDPGYRYDTHDGAPLRLDQLGLDNWPDVQVFWPAARSAEETGMKRGSAILCHGRMAERLSNLKELRRGRIA